MPRGGGGLGGNFPDAGGKIEPGDPSPGQPVCFGDKTWGACPAGNYGLPGHGCENSAMKGGALLEAKGMPKLSMDTLSLSVSGMPLRTIVVFMEGRKLHDPKSPDLAFGNGLLCLHGMLGSIALKQTKTGFAEYPEFGDPPLCDVGQIPIFGATMHYQVLYRDAGWLGRDHVNLSNAWSTVWVP